MIHPPIYRSTIQQAHAWILGLLVSSLLGSYFFQPLYCCTALKNTNAEGTAEPQRERQRRRIAIIGGGIGGTFAAKYLADYDLNCQLDSITIFDPYAPINATAATATRTNANQVLVFPHSEGDDEGQGGRVAFVQLKDGTIVELGASIIYSGNRLVAQMVEGDPDLVKGKPFTPGGTKEQEEETSKTKTPTGFAIYKGDESNRWALSTSNMYSYTEALLLLWRYNVDLIRVSLATSKALQSFNLLYDLLDSNLPASFLSSPDEMWNAVGLLGLSRLTFDDFLNTIGARKEGDLQWWRYMLPYQGSLRDELLTAANLCNNNQNNTNMNGLAGLVNFLASKGSLFSIKGGNNQLVQSAFQQALSVHSKACRSDQSTIKFVKARVKTVVSTMEKGIELFSSTTNKNLGLFDIVILAAPLQFSNISFFIRGSHFDNNALHPMPLNGLVMNGGDGEKNVDEETANEHSHVPKNLPPSASRQYTQVVTTVVSNATLNQAHFYLVNKNDPQSIIVTEQGKETLGGVTGITRLTVDGVFKMFSSNPLSEDQLVSMFGSHYFVEYEKVWGGRHGGATPNFMGGGEASASTHFMLYESGHESTSALYYVNTMETSVAAMEISAIGAKAVAKLVGLRLGLIAPSAVNQKDEL